MIDRRLNAALAVGDAGKCKRHLGYGESAHLHSVIHIAEMADAEIFACSRYGERHADTETGNGKNRSNVPHGGLRARLESGADAPLRISNRNGPRRTSRPPFRKAEGSETRT